MIRRKPNNYLQITVKCRLSDYGNYSSYYQEQSMNNMNDYAPQNENNTSMALVSNYRNVNDHFEDSLCKL